MVSSETINIIHLDTLLASMLLRRLRIGKWKPGGPLIRACPTTDLAITAGKENTPQSNTRENRVRSNSNSKCRLALGNIPGVCIESGCGVEHRRHHQGRQSIWRLGV